MIINTLFSVDNIVHRLSHSSRPDPVREVILIHCPLEPSGQAGIQSISGVEYIRCARMIAFSSSSFALASDLASH